MHRLFGGILLLQFDQILTHGVGIRREQLVEAAQLNR
jgi:hypothetical protein